MNIELTLEQIDEIVAQECACLAQQSARRLGDSPEEGEKLREAAHIIAEYYGAYIDD